MDLVSEYQKLRECLEEHTPLESTFLDYLTEENVSPILLSNYLNEFHTRRLCEDNYILTSGQFMQYLSIQYLEDPALVHEIVSRVKLRRKNSTLKPALAEIELNSILQKEINANFIQVVQAISFLLSNEIQLKGTLTSIKKDLINISWQAIPNHELDSLKTRCSNYLRAAANVEKALSSLRKHKVDLLLVKIGRDVLNIFNLEPERTELLDGLEFRNYFKAYLSNNTIEVESHIRTFLLLQKIAQDFRVEPLIRPKKESEYYAYAVAQQFASNFYADQDFSWTIAGSKFAEEFEELCAINRISLFQFCANLILLLKRQHMTSGSVVNSVAGFLLKTDKKLLARIISIPENDWERQLKSVRLGGSGNSTRKINPYLQGAEVPTEREFMNTKMSFRPHNSWKRRNT